MGAFSAGYTAASVRKHIDPTNSYMVSVYEKCNHALGQQKSVLFYMCSKFKHLGCVSLTIHQRWHLCMCAAGQRLGHWVRGGSVLPSHSGTDGPGYEGSSPQGHSCLGGHCSLPNYIKMMQLWAVGGDTEREILIGMAHSPSTVFLKLSEEVE